MRPVYALTSRREVDECKSLRDGLGTPPTRRLAVQPYEVAANWLNTRALSRARRKLARVGAAFLNHVDAAPGVPPPRRVVPLNLTREAGGLVRIPSEPGAYTRSHFSST